MLRIALKVKYDDGREQATMISAPDSVAFERHFDRSSRDIVTSGRTEYLLWITWHALHREGKVSDEFDTWLNGVAEVGDDEAAEVDIVPLASSQPTG